MSDGSKIEWTDSTWNPIRGCTRLTTGCGGPNHQGGCYAEKIAARFSDPGQPFHGFAERTQHGGRWTGKLALIDDKLTEPMRWRAPRRIFVNSMSDLFHENLPDEAIDRVFAVMARCPQHIMQVLTKRAARMRAYWANPETPGRIAAAIAAHNHDGAFAQAYEHDRWMDQLKAAPLKNVWLGVSTERQQEADERIPELLATPAAVRFISAEPLLGPIDLRALYHDETLTDAIEGMSEHGVIDAGDRMIAIDPQYRRHAKLDWVICGGESGPNARPMHPFWARGLRDQCADADVPFFFKQWGEHSCLHQARVGDEGIVCEDPITGHQFFTVKVGKKRAGRLLDGIEHNAMPERAA